METNKNNKRNLIITAIIIILIVFGIYFKGRKASDTELNDTNTEQSVDGEVSNTDTKDSNIVDDKALDVSSDTPVIVNKNNDNYNLAMTNASKAFLAKDYAQAIVYYNKALSYKEDDTAYSGLFTVYGAQGDWARARSAIDNAIKLDPSYTDYWVSKLVMLDEKTTTSYGDMEKIYQEGLSKVDSRYKINLITTFAVIAEKNGMITQAIDIWKYAQQVYSSNSAIYQGEIERLTKMIQ